ncbi:hypothetical protein BgiBS90_016588 [Biomphalaria glabrata]|nr:hypothetical protein BgiBS90_016588 [Biomphalaria glabrata]
MLRLMTTVSCVMTMMPRAKGNGVDSDHDDVASDDKDVTKSPLMTVMLIAIDVVSDDYGATRDVNDVDNNVANDGP